MHYIELNPVRAGMVSDPALYRWSSYRHNGLGQLDERLVAHPLYQNLGRDPHERRACYRALFRAELDDDAIGDIRLALVQSLPLRQCGGATGQRKAREAAGESAGGGRHERTNRIWILRRGK
jgi:hypothetical protein